MSLSARISFFTGAFCLFSLAAVPQSGAGSKIVSFQSEKLWPDTATMTIRGVLSKPQGQGPFPAAVLLPNCGGPGTFEFAKFWPKYLNELGYVTLNVDHFAPRKAKKCTKKFKPNPKSIAQDAYGALTYLADLPYVDKNRVGVLGSSLGALAINWFSGLGKSTSGSLKFRAAVSLYPSNCKKVFPSAGMIPTIIILGDKEKGIASCKGHPQHPELTVHVLHKTYHGFDQPTATRRKNGKLKQDLGGNKRLYSKSATQKTQSLVKGFLTAKLSESKVPDEAGAQAKVDQTDAPRLGKVGGKDPYMAVSKRDADRDGKVSVAEWDKSPNVFSKIDADGDGFLTPQEFYDRWQSRK